jgi:glycosyltransferase involved in cell wall biosynthesis
MGQELADDGLMRALEHDPHPHAITEVKVTGLRQTVPANRRLPLSKVELLPWRAQVALGKWAYRGHDIVHRLDLRLPPASTCEILTVQDLAPLRFPDEGQMPRSTARAIQRAAAVVCPSHFSADEVRREYSRQDVDVIPHGLDPAFLTPRQLSQNERDRLGLPQRWVIHSGGATLRKNLQGLAEAWPTVRSRYPDVSLVLCGPADSRRMALFGHMPEVRLLGKVPRTTLIALVGSAAAVVVPSLYEGYGLPALEAMASGVPLVATAAASLPEVAGPGAILVDANPAALAEGLCRALGGVNPDEVRRAQEAAQMCTWGSAAEAYKDVYSRVAAQRLARAA